MLGFGTALILVTSIVGDLRRDLRPEFIELFEKLKQEVVVHENNYTVNYRLYKPKIKQSSSRTFPLIVWLHGYGEGGTDNSNQLKWLDTLIFRPPRKQSYPFFMLAVQCSPEMRSWATSIGGRRNSGVDMLDLVKVVLDEVVATHPIDADRITLTGVSSGGSGCWEFAHRYPDLFAAVAPLGSDGAHHSDIARISHVPIWAFHSAHDARVSIVGVRGSVLALQRARGNACLTEIASADHNCWTSAFHQYGLLTWLLVQKRNSKAYLPGTVPIGFRVGNFVRGWHWWQVIVQIYVLAAFGLVTIRLIMVAHRLYQYWSEPSRQKKRSQRLIARR